MEETALALARKAGEHLGARGMENGRLEAELLLAGVLGLRRLDLYLQHDRPITAAELEQFRDFVRRRLRHEPLQYITGEAAFRGLVLRADRRALIPRPETEVLVGEVLGWAKGRGEPLTALDVGTGTGAIALSLALEGAFARVVATDVSEEALSLARENALRTGATDRVEFRHGTLLDPVGGERFDVIACNPPYIAEEDRPSLQPEVREYEPAAALFGGRDGYAVVLPLVEGAADVLATDGLLALEVGLGQAERVAAAMAENGRYRTPRIVEDLAGRPRIVLAERSGT